MALINKIKRNESGSALVYILIAIALLAALTYTFMEPSSQQTSSQNTFKTVASLQGQADMIRSSIQECVLSYPKGDNTIDISGGGSDPFARNNYPIDPDSGHYSSATPDQSGDHLVRNIRCPGNNPGTPNEANHALIFSGKSGKYLPPAPDLFSNWEFYNGKDGVFFWVSTDKTDSFILTALEKLDDQFEECEADVVETSGSDEDLDSAGTYKCLNGDTCFRVRMITTADAVWNGDTSTDEGDCD